MSTKEQWHGWEGKRVLARPNALIQWKGTDSCADYYCSCGEQFHIDGDFVYAVQCPYCEARWEVGCHVALNPLPPDWNGCEPRRGTRDDDEGTR